jgi:putative transposase
MNNKLRQRKNPRLKDFDYSQPYAYFVTICSNEKIKIFTNERLNFEIIRCLKYEKERTGMKVFVYCLMPDHLHMLISPLESALNISKFIGGFKSKTTRIGWEYGIRRKMWQGRFHDHIVRPNETLNDISEYILNNPVRKRIVKNWDEYKFCGLLDPVPA